MKWIFINYRLWQLCNLENEEAFFEANGESIRWVVSQGFLRYPAEQRNTITSHDSFRRMTKKQDGKLWKNYLKERSLSLLSKIGQVKAAFCILSNWSPFRNEDWLWERSQTQKWLRIRKSQTEGEASSTFSYCCNQTTSKYSFFIMYSTRDSWLLLNFQVILLCKRYQRYHH